MFYQNVGQICMQCVIFSPNPQHFKISTNHRVESHLLEIFFDIKENLKFVFS